MKPVVSAQESKRFDSVVIPHGQGPTEALSSYRKVICSHAQGLVIITGSRGGNLIVNSGDSGTQRREVKLCKTLS